MKIIIIFFVMTMSLAATSHSYILDSSISVYYDSLAVTNDSCETQVELPEEVCREAGYALVLANDRHDRAINYFDVGFQIKIDTKSYDIFVKSVGEVCKLIHEPKDGSISIQNNYYLLCISKNK